MRLILVRHGQTTANASHLLDTAHPGALLTELGQEQAEALVERLKDEDIDSIWTSCLTRTHQTAAPLAEALGLDINKRHGVREVEAGELEGLGSDEDYASYLGTVRSWLTGEVEARMGGENGVQCAEPMARFDEVVAEIEATGAKTAVVVTHGTMMTLWAGIRGEGLLDYLAQGVPTLNTGIGLLEGSLDEGYRALAWMGKDL